MDFIFKSGGVGVDLNMGVYDNEYSNYKSRKLDKKSMTFFVEIKILITIFISPMHYKCIKQKMNYVLVKFSNREYRYTINSYTLIPSLFCEFCPPLNVHTFFKIFYMCQ